MIEKICSLLAVLVICIAGYVFYQHVSDVSVGDPAFVAKIAPEAKGQPTVTVPVNAPIKTYQGKTKAKAKLPAAVVADPDKQVIASASVPSDLRPHSEFTVLDTKTGEVTSYDKVDPYPWLAVERRGEVRLSYGYKFAPGVGSQPVARLQANYDVLRVKALTLGVTGSVDSDRATFVGVGVAYKF